MYAHSIHTHHRTKYLSTLNCTSFKERKKNIFHIASSATAGYLIGAEKKRIHKKVEQRMLGGVSERNE